MEPKRHVSRWHAAAALAPTPPTAHEDDVQQQPEVSLRYLNEFVGKLQCASALLDHKLYPDAKEITEVGPSRNALAHTRDAYQRTTNSVFMFMYGWCAC